MQMETRLSLKFICPNTSQANSCRRSGEFVSKSLRVCMCVWSVLVWSLNVSPYTSVLNIERP